jgi:hypothetical protein
MGPPTTKSMLIGEDKEQGKTGEDKKQGKTKNKNKNKNLMQCQVCKPHQLRVLLKSPAITTGAPPHSCERLCAF